VGLDSTEWEGKIRCARHQAWQLHIEVKLRNKEDNFEWKLIAVYGATQENEKEAFLSERVRMCGTKRKPLLVGGDFNIIRSPNEKNNNRFNDRWSSILTLLKTT
jgi:hypothetical protein